jgi:hypothetical protein
LDLHNDTFHSSFPRRICWCFYANYDPGLEERWEQTELDIFQSKIGSLYYAGSAGNSYSYSYCSENYTNTVTATADPNITAADRRVDADGSGGSDDFQKIGSRIFSRGGAGPSKTAQTALEELGMGGDVEYVIEKLLPRFKPLELGSKFEIECSIRGIPTFEGFNTLFFVPSHELIAEMLGLSIEFGGGPNPKETTVHDIPRGGENGGCELKDPLADMCRSARDQIKQDQMGSQDQGSAGNPPPAGLLSNWAPGVRIKMHKGSTAVFSSSNSTYQGILTINSQSQEIISSAEGGNIEFSIDGDISSNQKIIETRLTIENKTTSDNMTKDKLSPADIFSKKGYLHNTNLKKITYSCAGLIDNLPISISNGLESMSVTISDAGFSSNISYSTRPAIFPVQDNARSFIGSDPSMPAIQVR